MKEQILSIKYERYEDFNELIPSDQNLLLVARESTQKAYAPYSNFKVGAAVLLANGEVIAGNNQENAAYPSGLCAERTALFYAGAQYPNVPVVSIAITAEKRVLFPKETLKPCGACRQVLSEFEEKAEAPIRIILDGVDYIDVMNGIDALLPFRFKKEALGE